jgi:hypothetical protein
MRDERGSGVTREYHWSSRHDGRVIIGLNVTKNRHRSNETSQDMYTECDNSGALSPSVHHIAKRKTYRKHVLATRPVSLPSTTFATHAIRKINMVQIGKYSSKVRVALHIQCVQLFIYCACSFSYTVRVTLHMYCACSSLYTVRVTLYTVCVALHVECV